MQRHSFKSGEIIFHEDAPSDAAFLIIEGQVEILHQRKSGDKTTVAILERGEYFGEMGVIDDKPRSATAKAKRNVTAGCLPPQIALAPSQAKAMSVAQGTAHALAISRVQIMR